MTSNPRHGRVTPRTVSEWSIAVVVWVGLFGLLVCLAVWIIANRVSPALLTTFGTLAGVATGVDALTSRPSPQPPIEPDERGST